MPSSIPASTITPEHSQQPDHFFADGSLRLVNSISFAHPTGMNEAVSMAEKLHHPQRSQSQKSAGAHGAFKHTSKGTTIKTVIGAYGLTPSDYKRVRELVAGKEPAHAR